MLELVLPMSSDDGTSGSNNDEVDVVQSSQPVRFTQKTKKAPVPRVMVEESQMVLLFKAYKEECAAFCKGRKQRPKQMIPGKVWDRIYHYH